MTNNYSSPQVRTSNRLSPISLEFTSLLYHTHSRPGLILAMSLFREGPLDGDEQCIVDGGDGDHDHVCASVHPLERTYNGKQALGKGIPLVFCFCQPRCNRVHSSI